MSGGLSSGCKCAADKWKKSLSCSGDAEAQDPGSLSARDYDMMAAMLRGTCPAIGKWSDLEFMLSKHCIVGEINLLS